MEIEARVVSATRSFARDIGTQLGFGWNNRVTTLGGTSGSGGTTPTVFTGGPGYLNLGGGPIPLISNLAATGETSAETVLLRLITERGRPSVKIGASEQMAGLSFAGPTGTRDTYVILQSDGRASSLKLRNEDLRELVLKP